MNRRDFLKGGTLLAACLVAGLKPTEPKKEPDWVGLPVREVSVMFVPDTHIGLYGGMAGGGKTPHPDDFGELLVALWNDRKQQNFVGGGFFVSPQKMADLLEATRHLA